MKQNGFTLMELMISVAIVGILLSFALNSYQSSVISANRTDGRSALLRTATSLEKCKAIYGTYNNANCGVSLPLNSLDEFYKITGSPSSSSFTLTASPIKTPQTDDAECTSMTLTNLGLEGGTGSDSSQCW